MQPPIKWSGSKRGQVKEILQYFPAEIDTYYEPFCGGASVMLGLLESGIPVNKVVCSDQNADLISLWNLIKFNPEALLLDYEIKYNELKTSSDRNQYYMDVRARFNALRNPTDFFFLDRNAFNGLIRYNSKGEFNSAFHFGRDGIEPKKISKIILRATQLLSKVEFLLQDFRVVSPTEKDFIYLDPPYINTTGMYHGGLSFDVLKSYLTELKCSYILSYDGTRNDTDYTALLPKELYTEHIYTKSAKSGFGKLNGSAADVRESLYIKR